MDELELVKIWCQRFSLVQQTDVTFIRDVVVFEHRTRNDRPARGRVRAGFPIFPFGEQQRTKRER